MPVRVSAILADVSISAIDSDGDTLGIAVYHQTGISKWQYSTDGVSGWTDFGAVAPHAALLLAETTWVRYVPDGMNGESLDFDFRGWDQSSGLASMNGTPRIGDTLPGGGTTAYSNGSASVSLTVSSVNDAPTIISVANKTATEDIAYRYTFTVADVDAGDALTLSAPTLPGWLTFNAATGLLSGTPTNAEVGDHAVVLRVNDGTVNVDQRFTITVSNVNKAPIIASVANKTATEDIAYRYTFTVADVDAGDTLTLSAPTLPGWLTFNTATGVLSGTPTNAEVGDHEVVLRVNDGTVNVDQRFTITVANVNNTPVITSGANTTATADLAYSYTFMVNDADVGDTLTLSAPTLPGWLTFNPGTGLLSGTPGNAEVGDHTVVLRVNDGTVNVDQRFTISVSNVNNAPVITSVPNAAATEGVAYSYSFTVADADAGDTLTMSAPALPGWLTFNATTGLLSGTPTNAEVGDHEVVLRVNDGAVNVDQRFTITVANVNHPGTVTIDNTSPVLGDTLTANVTDLDGISGAISYQWYRNGVVITGATATTYTTVQADVDAVISVTAIYTDDGSTAETLTTAQTVAAVKVKDTPVVEPVITTSPTQEESISSADTSGTNATESGEISKQETDIAPEKAETIAEPEEATVEDVPEPASTVVKPDPAEERVSRNRGPTNMRASFRIEAPPNFTLTRVAGVDVKDAVERLSAKAAAPDSVPVTIDPGQQLADQQVHAANLVSATAYLNMLNSMDDVRKEVAGDIAFNKTILGSAIAVSTGLSVGYVVWLVRGGMLLSTLLSSIPAWQLLDPLPILAGKKEDDHSDGDETLESILGQEPRKPEPQEKTLEPSPGPPIIAASDTVLKKDRP